MTRTTNRMIALLLVLAFCGSIMVNARMADADGTKVYEVTYATENLSTPISWVQSPYFNHPQYKETRFENYNNNAPIPPGGEHETAFYMVYREDGLYMFFQSAEPGVDDNGDPLENWLEIYIAAGEGDIPYHQIIIPTSGSPIEYYEWQTEFRHNRPLEGSVKIDSEPIPGGWGTVVILPWEAVYDSVPINGGNWQFNLIRWSPVDGQTWGGKVHQTGRFNQLQFQPPTPEQRMAIQKHVLTKAWNKFQSTSEALTEYWLINPATSETAFYHRVVLPLLVKGLAHGVQMRDLDRLNAQQVDHLFRQVPNWMELRYNVDDQRQRYIRNQLLHGNPPSSVTDATYDARSNTLSANGYIRSPSSKYA
ncbi:hypothetical protein [Paenibacillus sp. J2TS4]|uniref:hypothetical protein n=1 Tax=Paenibacillus sp. J2TS4 TaxID=2807194 RepID=UPI001B17E393|nr:hypothetical protein [Paenibacillus sp. J2TS4]GIP31771.1 hypothetical protein J2TS4_09810 [Paenibacillus sp. J2TS4]